MNITLIITNEYYFFLELIPILLQLNQTMLFQFSCQPTCTRMLFTFFHEYFFILLPLLITTELALAAQLSKLACIHHQLLSQRLNYSFNCFLQKCQLGTIRKAGQYQLQFCEMKLLEVIGQFERFNFSSMPAQGIEDQIFKNYLVRPGRIIV